MGEKNQGKTKKNDFVEIVYTGYANDTLFDSNKEEDLKKLDPKAKPKKTNIAIGQGMVVKGFDKELEGKEIGKEYEAEFGPEKGFGERKKEFVRTIPLKAFTEKNVQPSPGMILNMDNALAKIISVSGGRVVVDFNNPLAGKDIKYKFKIVRKIEDEKEKCDAVFENLFRIIPKYEIKEKEVVVKDEKGFEGFVNAFKDKFKELIGKELGFEEVKKEEKDKKTPQ